ncbi:unnamed protein product [Clavelina lepadiformis]|uniref:Uncharacterized protein n=1 Tax=Clavelina lepadiformis TaxID=159417 RepID=A0ABP0GG67_CLALP
MAQKSLEEKVKLLTKVNEEKNDDASLTVRQLVALVGISKRTLQDWQKNDANLREQREETMLRGRGLKTERERLRIGSQTGVRETIFWDREAPSKKKALFAIKPKARNQFNEIHDIRVALSKTEPNLAELVANKQAHPSQ